MALTASLRLVVPALPDDDVWFLNAAAWSNYWQNINMAATFDAYPNQKYVPSAFDNTLSYEMIIIDDVHIAVPSQAQFDSLKAQVAALDDSYQRLRTDLKDAGFIQFDQ